MINVKLTEKLKYYLKINEDIYKQNLASIIPTAVIFALSGAAIYFATGYVLFPILFSSLPTVFVGYKTIISFEEYLNSKEVIATLKNSEECLSDKQLKDERKDYFVKAFNNKNQEIDEEIEAQDTESSDFSDFVSCVTYTYESSESMSGDNSPQSQMLGNSADLLPAENQA